MLNRVFKHIPLCLLLFIVSLMPNAQSSDDDAAILEAQRLFSLAGDEYNFYRQSGFGEALTYLDQAQQIAPTWPYSYVLEGYIYYLMRDFDTATQNFTQALNAGASDDPAGYTYFRMGQALYDSGAIASAIYPLKEALERRPQLTFIARTYIGALGRSGLHEEALELGAQFQLIEPDDIGVAQIQWEALKATNKDPIEIAFQENVVTILATQYSQDFSMGMERCAQSFYDERQQIIHLTVCANMYINLSEYDTARQLADALLKISPDNPYSLMTAARVEFFDDNVLGAVKFYDEAYALHPVNSAIIFRRINSYREARIELPPEQIQDFFEVHARAIWPWLMDESGQTTLPVFAPAGYVIEFEGNQGDIFTFSANTLYLGDAITLILLVKDDRDMPIAGTILPIGSDGDEYNTRLANVELPATGTYTLWVGVANGSSSVQLSIEKLN